MPIWSSWWRHIQYVCSTLDVVGADVRAKVGDSRSNLSRDVRAAQFVMDNDERQWTNQRRNALLRFALKSRVTNCDYLGHVAPTWKQYGTVFAVKYHVENFPIDEKFLEFLVLRQTYEMIRIFLDKRIDHLTKYVPRNQFQLQPGTVLWLSICPIGTINGSGAK